MTREYYFISDLHIGGDGALDACEFEEDLIVFLHMLEQRAANAELIIAGDLLGLWETTTVEGPDKLHAIIASHIELFRQFQRTGRLVRITLIPGNHDHDLATSPDYGAILKTYNIHLEPREYIMRPVGDRAIWIEHGHQRDAYNRFEIFGNPACKPFGYYVTTRLISTAGQRARNRSEKWLKDIESVYPTEHVPHWLFSNYFYKEMSTYLRALFLPLALAFGASAVMIVGALLELCGIVAPGRFLSSFANNFGAPGYLMDGIVLVCGAALVTLLLFSLPLLLIRHDIRRVLLQYNFDLTQALSEKKNEEYFSGAEQVFREHPEVALFIFGHSHIASLTVQDGRAIVNTGSWIKRLTRIPSRFFILPDVYFPEYHLGYFHAVEEQDGIALYYHTLEKKTPESLSLMQRIAIYGQHPEPSPAIPYRTLLPGKNPTVSANNTGTQIEAAVGTRGTN